VPLLDLRRADPELDSELVDAFRRVLAGGHYILGPEVEAFESECAAYLGCKHAIGVSSGTDALLLALMALGIGAGDEVICPTYTFFATAGTIWRTGARPVFVDNSLADYNALADHVARKITLRTKAIIPVHLFGRMADTNAFVAAAGGIPIIEDAAQAFGAWRDGRRAGTIGAFGCFSFFPSKNLGGLGDSGLVTTNDDGLAEKARVLRAHGSKPKYHHNVVGGNFRIDALQAALLLPRLRRLATWTTRRQANAASYTELLARVGLGGPNDGRIEEHGPDVLMPAVSDGHIFNQYVVRITAPGARDGLRTHLRERGIETEVYYPVPMHLQECFAALGYRAGDLPFAERASRESLALPIFPELRAEEIHYVVDQIADFFSRR
jgi:dTDP-4-amino-4,6-dideoxygalactose transaminase